MKVLAKNSRATYDYQITDKLIAGIALLGPEVKSVKAGRVSLKGSYVNFKGTEAFLIGAHVSPYQFQSEVEPERTRKLLLHKKELAKLAGARQAGLSAVPLAILLQKNLVKVEIGVGKGKKAFDKRQTIKKRQSDRESARQVKN